MNLISKDAIAALGVVADEVRPLNGYYLPQVLSALTERYRPVKYPTIETVKTMGPKFNDGVFVHQDRAIQIAEFALYNDAISVTTNDTSDSEVVLNDLFEYLQASFGFRKPITKAHRFFQSDLVVDFESDITRFFAVFKPLVDFLQKNSSSDKKFMFSRLAFGTDPKEPGPSPEFLVERRVGTPWNTNRYFSKAHMRTEVHIGVLEILEKLAKR